MADSRVAAKILRDLPLYCVIPDNRKLSNTTKITSKDSEVNLKRLIEVKDGNFQV